MAFIAQPLGPLPPALAKVNHGSPPRARMEPPTLSGLCSGREGPPGGSRLAHRPARTCNSRGSGQRPCRGRIAAGSGPAPTARRVGELVDQSRSEEHTSELQSLRHLVCRLLLEKKKKRRK